MPNAKPSLLLVLAATALAGCASNPQRTGPVAQRAAAAMPACSAAAPATSRRFVVEPFDSGLPTTGQWRDGFDVADMDGDGNLDIVHGPARKSGGEPAIFRGDGAGHFTRWTEAHFPRLPYDYGDVKTGDFNGDGKPDIALASHLRGFVTLVNEGRGNFAPWGEGLKLYAPTEAVNTPILTSRAIAVTDWNGDGRADLLALNEGPSRFVENTVREALGLWINRNGDWERVRPAQELQGFGDKLAIGDIDGDGHPDALAGTQVTGMRLTLRQGDGTGWRLRELHAVPLDATVTAVALHDFDHDGRAEAVDGARAVENEQFCISLQHVIFTKDGGERWQVLFAEPSRDPFVAIVTGDFNRDGKDDIAAVRAEGGILLFAGGEHGFTRDNVIPPPADLAHCAAFDAKLVDLGKDKAPELVVSYAGDDDGSGGPQFAGGGGFRTWKLHRWINL